MQAATDATPSEAARTMASLVEPAGGALRVVHSGAGTKARQQRDIVSARVLWRDYRRRKREEA